MQKRRFLTPVTKINLHASVAILFGIAATIPASLAQETTDDDNVFDLSPFEVDASNDMGYYASQTLAGGRLSTDIINTGSSIEVITADFMDDIGANDIQELLQYTTNTEVGGNLGNFVGVNTDLSQGNVDSQGSQRNPDQNARIRGLARPDSTRDFYKTQIPLDQYNTERVDINRGSNSFLFGLGSPAGLINNQLSKAQFRNSTKLRFRVGSGGEDPSYRAELDVNRVIIKDKLAVRVAVMGNRTQYRQRPTFRDDNRIYAAFTFHPFDNDKRTTIRGHWESGDIYSNASATVLPNQALDTWVRFRLPIDVDFNTRMYRQQFGPSRGDVRANRWNIISEIDAVRGDGSEAYGWWPTYTDGASAANNFRRAGVPVMSNIGGAGFTLVYDGTSPGVSYIFNPQPNDQNANFIRAIGVGQFNGTEAAGTLKWRDHTNKNQKPDLEPGDPWWSPTGMTSGSSQMRFYGNSRGYDERGVGWYKQGFIDLETFDFSKQHLAGDNDFWERDFYNYNVSLEHVLLDGRAGFEIGYDFQHSHHNTMTFFSAAGADIMIDINRTIPAPRIDASGQVVYPQYDFNPNLKSNPAANIQENTKKGYTLLPLIDDDGYVVGGAMPNPNFGRPFINSRRGDGHNVHDNQTLRATFFYKLDFEDISGDDGWMRWLGQHTISALGDSWLEEYDGIGSTLRSYSDDFDVGKNVGDNSGTSVVAAPRQVGSIAYIGPPVQSYLGDDVWNPLTPLSMSQIILEPANYDMKEAMYTPGWSKGFWYWDRGGPKTAAELGGRDPIIGTTDYINGDEQWRYAELKPQMTPNEAVQRRRTEVKSWAVNSQSFFFNRHLVLNMGYREDFIKSWLNRQAPKSEFDQRPNVDLSVFRAEDGDLSEVKKSPDGSGVFGYGAVLHWPKSIIKIPESMDISFHYNFSENFIPDTSRQTINADRKLIRLAAPVGSSLDYGVTFQLFDRRLIVRLNWYENKLDGADGSVGNIFNQNLTQMFNFYGNNFRRIVQLDSPTGVLDPTLPNNGIDGEISNWTFVDQYAADEDGNIPDDIPIEELRAQIIADNFPNFDESVAAVNELYDILQSGYWQIKESRNRVRQFADGSIDQEDVGSLTDEEDIKSTGFEASITWNPTRSWRMAINVARQETVRSNITPNLERFIEGDWLPFIAKWGHLDWDNALATNNGNDLSTQVNENLTEYFTVMSLEGFPTDEVREWRVNLVTNYSFRDGPLNGFSVGGSMRWQSDAVIGYPLIEKEGSPMLVGDVLNGWRGEEDLSFDFQCGYSKRIKKVNWQIQLNLRNLQNIDSDEVEILIAQPDGSPAKARWKPPFQWQITNTFRW